MVAFVDAYCQGSTISGSALHHLSDVQVRLRSLAGHLLPALLDSSTAWNNQME